MAGLCHDLAATAGAVHRCEKELILQGLQGKIQEASWIQLVQKKHQSPSTSLDSPCLVCFFLAQHKFALAHQSASPLLRDVERVFTKQTWTLSVGITQHKYDDDYDGIPDVTTIRKTIVVQSSIATSNTKMMSRRLDASGKDDPQLRRFLGNMYAYVCEHHIQIEANKSVQKPKEESVRPSELLTMNTEKSSHSHLGVQSCWEARTWCPKETTVVPCFVLHC